MPGRRPGIHAFLFSLATVKPLSMVKGGYVYIMTNRPHGTLYVGVTADMERRASEHRAKIVEGFTKRYGLTRLVYYEHHDEIVSAIGRENNVKDWDRAWKIRLIERLNPAWDDLCVTLSE